MKKFLLAFLIGTATLAVSSSCTKEYYDTVPSISKIATKTKGQWVYNSDLKAWYVDVDVAELTDYYVDQGIVNVSVSFDGENTYNVIPATVQAVAYYYDYTTGSVRIYIEDPILDDGITLTPPENIVVKVSLTDADYVE